MDSDGWVFAQRAVSWEGLVGAAPCVMGEPCAQRVVSRGRACCATRRVSEAGLCATRCVMGAGLRTTLCVMGGRVRNALCHRVLGGFEPL